MKLFANFRLCESRSDSPGDAGADGTKAGAQAEEGAYAELQLGDAARFYPSDAALARWRSQADAGRAVIAYE